ncbi:Reverse transcriptase zinc-binding domain [Arabidopsis suecica]|uniref:Reverse transcriptase zinc-binding domain n=1 Tax=Arabidopsis suecica TaxID=45249 RepID=A0A8T2BQ62_ARASU|nr:Reverse transcriptase zinc-binding domain [Arabidopsis suecica]
MSCFKLPQGIISEIESLLMNFWWEKTSKQRGIPWIAWKKLQYSKKEGGLGFRDLAKFNDALLAKQAWRIIQHPHSLFAKIMKARYFRDESILDAKVRKYQSYGWASLLSGVALLKKGTKYIVGDGKTIRLGIDNVLEDHPPKPIRVADPGNNIRLETLISMNGMSRSWDISKIASLVDQRDQALVQNIHLSKEVNRDTISWNYNTSGDYSVRSGYWLLTHDPDDLHNHVDPPPGSVDLKNSIWKLPLMPKIKHFLWRALSRALATTSRLATRGMHIDTTCPRCRREEESINHALFTCPFATMVWRLSNSIPLHGTVFSPEFDTNISLLLSLTTNQTLQDDQKLLPFWLLWRIWKSRNNFVFNKARESATKTVLKAQAEIRQWLTATYSPTRRNHRTAHDTPLSPPRCWTAPPPSFIKCNFDAAYDIQTQQVTAGWIIRDHHGTPKHWGSLKLGQAATPLEAETKALLAAMQQSWIRGYKATYFEGDCEILIQTLNNSKRIGTLTNLFKDIHFWARKFQRNRFIFTKREGNAAAHCLAKFGCISSTCYSNSVTQPLWLQKQLCIDISNLI